MKKALIFSISLLLITVGALLGAVLVVQTLEDNTKMYKQIGDSSFSLLWTFGQSQKSLLKIDQIAKYAVHTALTTLAKNGGITENCGIVQKEDDFSLWNTPERKCYKMQTIDKAIEKKIKEALQEEFTHQGIEFISAEDYDFYIKPNPFTVHGIASKPQEFSVEQKWSPFRFIEEDPNKIILFAGEERLAFRPREQAVETMRPIAWESKLVIRPSFTVTVPYDFRIYDTLYAFADTVLANCATADDKQACVNNAIAKIPQEYSIQHDSTENTYFFTANTASSYENPYTGKTIPPIKFALDLTV